MFDVKIHNSKTLINIGVLSETIHKMDSKTEEQRLHLDCHVQALSTFYLGSNYCTIPEVIMVLEL